MINCWLGPRDLWKEKAAWHQVQAYFFDYEAHSSALCYRCNSDTHTHTVVNHCLHYMHWFHTNANLIFLWPLRWTCQLKLKPVCVCLCVCLYSSVYLSFSKINPFYRSLLPWASAGLAGVNLSLGASLPRQHTIYQRNTSHSLSSLQSVNHTGGDDGQTDESP